MVFETYNCDNFYRTMNYCAQSNRLRLSVKSESPFCRWQIEIILIVISVKLQRFTIIRAVVSLSYCNKLDSRSRMCRIEMMSIEIGGKICTIASRHLQKIRSQLAVVNFATHHCSFYLSNSGASSHRRRITIVSIRGVKPNLHLNIRILSNYC